MSGRASFGAMLILLGALCSAAPAQEPAGEARARDQPARRGHSRAVRAGVGDHRAHAYPRPGGHRQRDGHLAGAADQEGVWDLFQSVLRVQGFAALRSGTIWRVIPQAAVREAGGELSDDPDAGRSTWSPGWSSWTIFRWRPRSRRCGRWSRASATSRRCRRPTRWSSPTTPRTSTGSRRSRAPSTRATAPRSRPSRCATPTPGRSPRR